MRNIWLRMRRRLSLCYIYTAFISRFIYILASANLSHHLLAPTKGVKFKSKEGVQAFWNRGCENLQILVYWHVYHQYHLPAADFVVFDAMYTIIISKVIFWGSYVSNFLEYYLANMQLK